MSYRDLRAFCEMMRGLGFPRLVSVENFRNPNFPLVAELMAWLVKRYDPDADVPQDIDSEQDRVIFVRSVAQLMAEKAHVRLNTKKLYEADGRAVKEMLKVASVLYDAIKNTDGDGTVTSSGGITNDDDGVPVAFDVASKIADLKRTRQLATEITVCGAKLYDLLGKEVHLRQARNTALGRQLELTDVENNLRRAISQVEQEIKQTQENCENITQEETAWDGKIEKKRVELDRTEKRLQTLRKVRPAFMDEYEKLEGDFKRLYEEYITRFRCLAFLEQQLEDYERTEQLRVEERQQAAQKLLEKLRQEEEKRLQGYNDLHDDDDDEDDEEILNGATRRKAGAGGQPRATSRRFFGTMTGGESENSDSLESDSELELDDDLKVNHADEPAGPSGINAGKAKRGSLVDPVGGSVLEPAGGMDPDDVVQGDVVANSIATGGVAKGDDDGVEGQGPAGIDDDDDF